MAMVQPSKLYFPCLFKFIVVAAIGSLSSLSLVVGLNGEAAAQINGGGQWQLLINDTGVVGMHMALTHLNTVIIFDQTGAGPSRYMLRHRFNGTRCNPLNDISDNSCYAHSIEHDISTNKLRALNLDSDLWCSSASFLSNGTLLQSGGYRGGSRRIRYFSPCTNGRCHWKRSVSPLAVQRWYATSLLLPEKDRVILVGGRRTFSYEFIPKLSSSDKAHYLPFLHLTRDRNDAENNLYPFLHLSSDGNLFIFANRDSILFDYRRNRVVKTFPRIPGQGSRSYPSSGSSVILPLDHRDQFRKVEVMVCGGAATGAYQAAATRARYLSGLNSCGRMVITSRNPRWRMEKMPGPRLLHDMVILPTGHILIINGARSGCGGWNNAANPSLHPYLYNPNKLAAIGKTRFSVLRSTTIARLYHSSATLLPDGRVLVAGSNPNRVYTFDKVAYRTELRMEVFVPHHMDQRFDRRRPRNVSVHFEKSVKDIIVPYGREFTVNFQLLTRRLSWRMEFSVYAPPFTTHSNGMNQRMLLLRSRNMVRREGGWVSATVEAPPSPNVAPSGYYMLTVVNDGIPSVSQWVRFVHSST